ncbi:MAG: exodeoxyribonuclease VII large subunit [Spirochaetes bacterium]|nr:exodeoxyribonuclease VII large subunit [Spirochaetota bacterium]
MDDKNYLSISDFTKILKNKLENSYPLVYLKGEISNFRPSSSGHWYFALKDEFASIKAIIFKGAQNSIITSLKAGGYKGLEDGQAVLAEGRISVYERSGEYSIIISSLLPFGIGELTVKFQMLKDKLSKEGLFDPESKKNLPQYPNHIGIVTSPTGAALQDILNVLKRRFASIKITVFPASVQGESAKKEIADAIDFASYNFNKNTKYKVDVLLIARGGGSIEDLWPFNEEIVAYSIYNCPIPVITGIGHEIDFTIADFCADLRAPTPSAAAEIVVKNSEELLNSIAALNLRMQVAVNNCMEKFKLRLSQCTKERLSNLFEIIYENNLQDFSYLKEKMVNSFYEKYNNLRQRFIIEVQKLDGLSPLKILNRGYSVVFNKNHDIIKSFDQVKITEELRVILSKGELTVNVKEINDKSKFS